MNGNRMCMRLVLRASLVATLLAGFVLLAAQEAPWIRVKSDRVAPRSEVRVEYKVPFGYDESAWIGFIPMEVPHGNESVNDEYDACYQYVGKTISGYVVLPVPDMEGLWDIRLNDSDNSGLEVASITVLVTYEVAGGMPIASYDAGGAEPKPAIQAAPSKGAITAAVEPGADSILKASESRDGITLFLDKAVYFPGEAFEVTMTSTRKMSKSNLFVILPHDMPAPADLAYLKRTSMYTLSGAVKGNFSLVAPSKPGLYDLRLYDSSTKGNPLVILTIQVE